MQSIFSTWRLHDVANELGTRKSDTFSRDYDVKRPFLNRAELVNLQRQQPELHRVIMAESYGQRRAYASLIGAALSSGGEPGLKQVSFSTSRYYTQTYIMHNGGLILGANMGYRGNTGDVNVVVSAIHKLNAGDYVELYANTGSGSTLTLGGHATDHQTHFGMVRT